MPTILENNTINLQSLMSAVSSLPSPKKIQSSKVATPSNVEQTILPDAGFDGMSSVSVSAISYPYQDITAPLNELNAVNGGAAAATLDEAIDNSEALTNDHTDLITQITEALSNKVGASPATPKVLTTTPSSNARNISFSGLENNPSMFVVIPSANTSLSSSTRYATSVVYDGSSTRGIYSNNSTATHTTNGFTFTYSDGKLTINTASTTNGGYFRSGVAYRLVYM